MKIAYITMQFPVPSETFASLDVETLIHAGNDVSVYALRNKHKKFDEMMKDRGLEGKVNVIHFSLFSFLISLIFMLRHPLISISLFFWILRCCFFSPKHLVKSLILYPSSIAVFSRLYKSNYDVVHLFWGHYPSMVGMLVKKFVPKTVTTMFLGAHDLLSKYPGSIDLSKKVGAVFTHSYSNLSHLLELDVASSKVIVVHRGTKISSRIESINRSHFPIRFLTACRLIKDKGVDDVIKVFSEVLKKNKNCILEIAGDGPYKVELLKVVSKLGVDDNVFFLGHVSQRDLLYRMSCANYFILMSRHKAERLPNVIKESMLQGCVSITTETVGIQELVTHKEDGYIVETNDIKSAVKYIEETMVDIFLFNDISLSAVNKIHREFSVDISMKKYCSKWLELKSAGNL